MFLRSLTLKHIRSFVDFHLSFAEGMTLLTGDIGSGKSTILLAIDFALFGLRRGELPGNALLRHGVDQGSVALAFTLSTGDVLIKRSLKRSTQGIVQDFGYLEVNGKGQECTSVELKQRVLELLHYPQDTLTKKSSLYKYTVYTPQEELKFILSGDAEERLQTLRKVFSIDKYQRIAENTKVVLSSLREQKRELAGQFSDLGQFQNQFQETTVRVGGLRETLQALQSSLGTMKQSVQQAQLDVQQKEQQLHQYALYQQELAMQQATLYQHQRTFQTLQQRLTTLSSHLQSAFTFVPFDKEDHTQQLQTLQTSLSTLQQQSQTLQRQIVELELQKKHHSHLQQSISTLATCPTCLQQVSSEYKFNFLERETLSLQQIEEQLKTLTIQHTTITSQHFSTNQALESLKLQEYHFQISLVKQAERLRLEQEHKTILQEHTSLQSILQQTQERVQSLTQALLPLQELQSSFAQAKKTLDALFLQEKHLSLQEARHQQEITLLQQRLLEIQTVLDQKILAQTRHDRVHSNLSWIMDTFLPLLDHLERSLFLQVHRDFQLFFQQWAMLLLDPEAFTVSLDESFTPVLQDHGHDTDFAHLSGGERSALSLAYRFALNQVINSLLSELHTKGFLILDEPTDGFSAEQLEKLRAVFEQLSMKQVLLVSHEHLLEGFVDQVLHLVKIEGESRLV